MFEAIIRSAPYGAASSSVDDHQLEEIVKVIPRLAVPPWRWCGRTQIHAGGGAFMVAIPDVLIGGQRSNDIWIGAKEQEPLLFLRSFPDIDWHFAAFLDGDTTRAFAHSSESMKVPSHSPTTSTIRSVTTSFRGRSELTYEPSPAKLMAAVYANANPPSAIPSARRHRGRAAARAPSRRA
jgi:hypothetical protein